MQYDDKFKKIFEKYNFKYSFLILFIILILICISAHLFIKTAHIVNNYSLAEKISIKRLYHDADINSLNSSVKSVQIVEKSRIENQKIYLSDNFTYTPFLISFVAYFLLFIAYCIL